MPELRLVPHGPASGLPDISLSEVVLPKPETTISLRRNSSTRPLYGTMFDTNEHIDQPLLNDDHPSWVTMENTDTADESELPWDRPKSSPPTRRQGSPGGGSNKEDIPKVVLFMRLGNVCAAALLIFGSVRSTLAATPLTSFSYLLRVVFWMCSIQGLLTTCHISYTVKIQLWVIE